MSSKPMTGRFGDDLENRLPDAFTNAIGTLEHLGREGVAEHLQAVANSWFTELKKLRASAAASTGGGAGPASDTWRVDWKLLQETQSEVEKTWEEAKSSTEGTKAYETAVARRDSWAGHYLHRILKNRAAAPQHLVVEEAAAADQLLVESSGADEWITDMLPEHDSDGTSDYVLISVGDDVLIGYYRFLAQTWHEREDGQRVNVSGWMPRPKAYQPALTHA